VFSSERKIKVIINRAWVVAVGVFVPLAIAHGLNTFRPDRPLDMVMLFFLELVGFTFLMALLRPRPLVGALAAIAYFPLMFVVIFSLGYSAGYYDLP
jgi:hypothetical protein